MKKILIITIFTLLLLGIGQRCWAQETLILDYPELELGEERYDLGPDTKIPELIRYIFLFALGIVGFVALLSMMIAAVLYVTSAGNPSKMSDAKDRIMSAVLGIIILLASVLILGTISPDLVNIGIEMPVIRPVFLGGVGLGNHLACFCYSTLGEQHFSERCYAQEDDCDTPCNTFCRNQGWFNGGCYIDAITCPD